jgi:hypothetical protein
MNDSEIRRALKQRVLARYASNPESLVIDELGLRHGAVRVDIAVVNGMIHGFEIKGENDTLRRLPRQARIYSSVLDRATLVVSSRHLETATAIVPDWWGVKRVTTGPRGAIRFSTVRRSRNNPSPDGVAIAKLLWRDEAIALLEDVGEATGVRSRPRAEVYQRLAEVVHLDAIRSTVRRQLKHRKNWRSGEQQTSGDG